MVNYLTQALSVMEQAIQSRRIIIYGAHLIALDAYKWLEDKNVKVVSFVVSELAGNPDDIEGIPVKSIWELPEKWCGCFVLVALPEKYHESVIRILEERGFLQYGLIGIKDISALLAESSMEYLHKNHSGIVALTDPNDITWLDLLDRKDIEAVTDISIGNLRHYKLQLICRVPFLGAYHKFWENFDFYGSYQRICGPYLNLNMLPVSLAKTGGMEQLMQIYMVTSKADARVQAPSSIPAWGVPILAGSVFAGKNRDQGYHDDEGDHISYKNKEFAEMTAMYWIWKSSPYSKYKGMCHYRRHFCLSEEQIYSLEENGVDVILTTVRIVCSGVKNFFEDTPAGGSVYETMMEALKTLNRSYYEYAKTYFEGCFYYPNNMLIAREPILNQYCQWIFPILFYMEDKLDYSDNWKYGRYAAYAAEMLTSLYFVYHKKHWKIVETDYKLIE